MLRIRLDGLLDRPIVRALDEDEFGEDADGAWIGDGHGFDASPEAMPSESFGPMGVELATLSGEGAYEGLSAILVLYVDVTDWGAGEYVFEGYIYEGEPPPVPDAIEPGLSLGE